MRKMILLTLSLLLLLAGQGWGATKYVATNGDDAAAGTEIAPYGTLEYAIEGAASNDTIIIRGGTYDAADTWKTGSDKQILANKNLTLQAYTGESVTINIPADSTTSGLIYLGGTWIFDHLNFTNTNNANAYFFWLKYNAASNVTARDCTFDNNNYAHAMIQINASIVDSDATLTFQRCKFNNLPASRQIVSNAIGNGHTANITFSACLIRNVGWVLSSTNALANVSFVNNTVVSLKNTVAFYDVSSTCTLSLINNIIVGDTTFDYPIYAKNYVPTGWTVHDNIVYRAIAEDPETNSTPLATAGTEMFPLTADNYYIEPGFTNAAGDNYTLTAASYASGRGEAASCPAGGDVTGAAWTGADVGCYANPGAAQMPTITAGTVAFVGDSIAQGTGNLAATNLTGWTVVGNGNLGAAIGGSYSETAKWLIDRAAITWGPEYAVIITGHNNFKSGVTVPTNATYQQAADDLMVVAEKCTYWGITPIFLGNAPASGANYAAQTTVPIAFNAVLEAECIDGGYAYASITDRMVFNTTFANAFNAAGNTEGYYGKNGLAGNVHPNTVGYQLILSLAEDLLEGKDAIYVSQSGTSVVGTRPGPGTYSYPISIADLNLQYAHDAYVDLPTGVNGQTISGIGTITTTFDTPAAGAASKPFLVTKGNWAKGIILDQQFWGVRNAIVSGDDDANSNGILVSAANSQGIYNCTITGCVDAIENSQNVAVTNNIITKNTNGVHTTANAATLDYNVFWANTADVDGAVKGAHDITCNPKLRNYVPYNWGCCSKGSNVSLTEDYNGQTVPRNGKYPIGAKLPMFDNTGRTP